jgi:hypothetical protein
LPEKVDSEPDPGNGSKRKTEIIKGIGRKYNEFIIILTEYFQLISLQQFREVLL